MTPIADRCRFLLTGVAAVAATALLAAPATAATVSSDASCPDTPVVQPFAQWGDSSDYFLAPNGGFEQGASGWALQGRADVRSGNEPFAVNGDGDGGSLRMMPGSSATSAPFCISAEHRTMRFVGEAPATSSLDVDVIVEGAGSTSSHVYRVATERGAGEWAPSAIVPMVVNEVAASQGGSLNVRLRFSPHGAGAWTIDDIFVDPFRVR